MEFYDYWQEQEARRQAEEHACLDRAHAWIGRRVWVRSSEVAGHQEYGEVVSVDGRGMVFIVTGYSPQGQPWGYTVSANMLGRDVVLADGKP
jgi:hypothetical protein